MKSYKEIKEQFITESRWRKYIYHATDSDHDPKDIKPGSHFGTLKAATDRAKSRLDWWGDPKKYKIHAYEYHAKPGAPHYENDLEMVERGENTEYKKPKKHDYVTYTNHSEDPGSKSYQIWDTHNLKYVHTFNSPKTLTREKQRKNFG